MFLRLQLISMLGMCLGACAAGSFDSSSDLAQATSPDMAEHVDLAPAVDASEPPCLVDDSQGRCGFDEADPFLQAALDDTLCKRVRVGNTNEISA